MCLSVIAKSTHTVKLMKNFCFIRVTTDKKVLPRDLTVVSKLWKTTCTTKRKIT